MNHSDEQIIAQALEILARNLRQSTDVMASPQNVKRFLTLRLAREEREVFGVLWLNTKNELILAEDLFFGTLTQAAVYPREVVKRALAVNAASMICYHNHPSGKPEPSDADKILTSTLRTALQLVDVRVLDHVIVGGTQPHSFAENGEI